MKFFRFKATSEAAPSAPVLAQRRGLVVGAGVAGASALAAAALHRRVATPAPLAEATAAAAASDGYRETEHVLRYYETTRS